VVAVDPPVVAFAGLLRQLRMSAGLSQEELAETAGVGTRTVSDLERGVALTARKDTARLLADALNLSGTDRAAFEAAARRRTATGVSPALGGGLAGAAGAAAATRALPRDIGSFTGRQLELRQLVEMTAGSLHPGVVSIHAIGGMAGIGKTALAVHAAHRLVPRFPDGQIFLPLHGHTPGQRPVDPVDALASLLLTAGVPAAQIPPGLEARTALWRDRLAGRQLLLLLDDAADSEQVRPLLPGSAGSLVLVTSRRHLTALEDVQTVSLDILPSGQAAELLVRLAARPGLDPGDPDVAEMTRLCGYLPLAIGMLARQLHHHPAWTAADLAADLAVTRDRLQMLHAEDLSVAAAFDLSYQDLTLAQQRLFRRLGLHPGPDTDAYAAAALDGTDLIAARRGLEALYDYYLIAEPTRGRYRFHDLIREHARALAGQDDLDSDRDQAVARLLAYYTAFAERASEQLRGSDPAHLAALDRLEAEHDNLRAALAWSLETPPLAPGDRERVATGLRLVQALALFWYRHGHLAEGRRWLERAIDLTAEDGGAPLAQLAHWLGVLLQRQGEPQAALRFLERSLAIWRDLGDRDQQARELNSLGITHHHLDDFDTARSLLEQSAALCREVGTDMRLAAALTNLGQLESDAGNFDRATQVLQEALALDRKEGDMLGVAIDQQSLAGVHLRAGRAREARDLLAAMAGYVVSCGDPELLATTLEMSAANAAQLGQALRAARLTGAAEAVRHKTGNPIKQPELLERFLAPVRATTEPGQWDAALAAGRALTQPQAAALLTSSIPGT
jgi:transcriptional regulator with XRE-family HTH domain/tetratricopeptide (TPR) repeat protein